MTLTLQKLLIFSRTQTSETEEYGVFIFFLPPKKGPTNYKRNQIKETPNGIKRKHIQKSGK